MLAGTFTRTSTAFIIIFLPGFFFLNTGREKNMQWCKGERHMAAEDDYVSGLATKKTRRALWLSQFDKYMQSKEDYHRFRKRVEAGGLGHTVQEGFPLS